MTKSSIFLTSALTLACSALSACGATDKWLGRNATNESSSPAPEHSDARPSAPILVGTWERGCQADSSDSVIGAKSTNQVYTFTTDGTIVAASTSYEDTSCNGGIVRAAVTGHYVLGEENDTLAGAFNLDFNAGAATYTLLDPMRTIINPCSGGFYLFGTVSCGSVSDSFNIVKIDGNILHLGDLSAHGVGSAANKRPTSLSNAAFTKSN